MGAVLKRIVSITLVTMIFTASACSDGTDGNDVCDEYEATEYGDDCGYWDETNTFIWYSWVVPYKGGTPSKGVKPTPPPGVKTNPPPKAKPPLPPGVKPPPPKAPPVKPPAPKPPIKGK